MEFLQALHTLHRINSNSFFEKKVHIATHKSCGSFSIDVVAFFPSFLSEVFRLLCKLCECVLDFNYCASELFSKKWTSKGEFKSNSCDSHWYLQIQEKGSSLVSLDIGFNASHQEDPLF